MGFQHVVNPLYFPGEIAVIGAGFGAALQQGAAVKGIGPHGGHHHLGLSAQLGQGNGVAGLGHQAGQIGLAKLGFELGQFTVVAPGDGPLEFGFRLRVDKVAEVAGEDFAHKTGSAVNNDVEGLVGHSGCVLSVG